MQWYVFKKEADIEGCYLLYQETKKGIWRAVRFSEPYAGDEKPWGLDVVRASSLEPVDEFYVLGQITEFYQQEFFRWVFNPKTDLSTKQISGWLS